MKNKEQIIISDQPTKSRLDVFLAEKLKITRSQAKEMIDNGLIEINNKKPKKAGDRIKMNDELRIMNKELIVKPVAVKSSIIIHQSLPLKPKILFTDKNYLIVEKPAGLLVHPTPASEYDALSEYLTNKYPEIKKVGDNPAVRPGIVHRLDREASGLLVVARTQKMFKHLKKQFQDHEVNKEYIILVNGQIEANEGLIDFPLQRNRKTGRMSSLPKLEKGLPTDKGKTALTEFEVIKRFVNYTLLKVKIHSGRMHQIRAHFLAYNHPVVGDTLYRQKQYAKWEGKLNRLFLHSAKLGFKNLEGEWVEYSAELPKELEEFLGKIK